MTVRAPHALDIFSQDQRGPSVRFFESLRANSRRAGIGVKIDLSLIDLIRPSGAVMLLAEMSRMAFGQPASTYRILHAKDPVVHAVMCQVGVYDASSPVPEKDREDVRHWNSATGVLSEGEKGGSILQAYEGRMADKLTGDLYAGIVEAMTNTVHHAYRSPAGEKLKKFIGRRWWALSQERNGELTVTICDLGIGIPRSLPRSSTFENAAVRAVWIALGLDRSDASAIKVAIELGRTRTGQAGRGRGLSEIVDAANLSKDGRVLISSNKGVFVSTDSAVKAHNHSHSIRGTLIHWVVRLSKEET